MRRLMLVVMVGMLGACGGEEPEAARSGLQCWEPAYDPDDPDFSICVRDPDPDAGTVECIPLDVSQGVHAWYMDKNSTLPCDQKIWRLESVWRDDVTSGVLLASHSDPRAYLMTLVCDCP